MSFDVLAKNLLSKTTALKKPDLDILTDLENSGFSRSDLLHEYRSLYDQTDDEAIKARILKDISNIHPQVNIPKEDQRTTPTITINVFGDNARVAAMLCPPLVVS